MKSLDDVYSEVKDFITKHLNHTHKNIGSESSISDLTNDSIQLFELLIAFEKHYKMQAAYEDVVNLHTVGDIAEYVFHNKYSQR